MTDYVTTIGGEQTLRRQAARPAPDFSRIFHDITPWLVPLLLLAAWQAACTFGALSDAILPSPASVLEAGCRLTLTGE